MTKGNNKENKPKKFLDNKTSEESNNEVTEKPKQPKFVNPRALKTEDKENSQFLKLLMTIMKR